MNKKISKTKEKKLYEIFIRTVTEYFNEKENIEKENTENKILYFGDILERKEYKVEEDEKGNKSYIY